MPRAVVNSCRGVPIELEYEDLGANGQPNQEVVLLCHGLGCHIGHWSRETFIQPLLSAGFRVIVYDNRDMGFSTYLTLFKPQNLILRRLKQLLYALKQKAHLFSLFAFIARAYFMSFRRGGWGGLFNMSSLVTSISRDWVSLLLGLSVIITFARFFSSLRSTSPAQSSSSTSKNLSPSPSPLPSPTTTAIHRALHTLSHTKDPQSDSHQQKHQQQSQQQRVYPPFTPYQTGTGLFAPTPPVYSLADMADDAAGLLTHLNINQAHVVGVSMGGMISQLLKYKYPDRIKSLTIIMSSSGAKYHHLQPKFSLLFRLFVAPAPKDDDIDGWVKRLAENNLLTGSGIINQKYFGGLSRETFIRKIMQRIFNRNGVPRQIEAVESAASRDEILHIMAPDTKTLFIHGTKDGLVPCSNAIHMHNIMKNSISVYNEKLKINNNINTSINTNSNSSTSKDKLTDKDYSYLLQNKEDTIDHYDVANGQGYSRLYLAKGHGHELPDDYCARLMPVLLDHLHLASK